MAIDSVKIKNGLDTRSQKFADLSNFNLIVNNNGDCLINDITITDENPNNLCPFILKANYEGTIKDIVDNCENADISIMQSYLTGFADEFDYNYYRELHAFTLFLTHDNLSEIGIVNYPYLQWFPESTQRYNIYSCYINQLDDLRYIYNGSDTVDRAPDTNANITGYPNIGDNIISFGLLHDQNGKAWLLECVRLQAVNKVNLYIFNNDRLTSAMLLSKQGPNYWTPATVGRWQTVELNLIDSLVFDYGGGIATSNPYKGGSWDDTSDTIEKPPKPTKTYCNNGCGTLYVVDNLKPLMRELFPDIKEVSTITDIPDAINNIFELQQSENLKKYIIDVICVPFHVDGGSATPIKVGWKTLQTMGSPISNEYIDIDLGSYVLPLYYGNFMDLEGTNIKLFLPFYGFVDINSELLNGGTVGIEYRFNVLTGDFIIWVRCYSAFSNLKGICQQYTGNASIHFPLNAINNQSQVNGLIQSAFTTTGGVAKVVGGAMTNNGGDVLSGAQDVVSGVLQGASAKPTASSSNAYSSSSGYMSIRKPFLLIDRQVPHYSATYPSEIGVPSYVSKKLADTHGLTICQIDDIAIENAMREECEEIVALMRGGIIL